MQQLEKTTDIDENIDNAQLVEQSISKEFFDLIVSIPWGHHTTILRKLKDLKEAIFYANKTVENNWS